MPNLRQRIVLGENRHGWPTSATTIKCGAESGFDATNAAFHGKSVLLQGVRQQLGGVMLLVVELGVSMDVHRHRHQFFAGGIDGLGGGIKAHAIRGACLVGHRILPAWWPAIIYIRRQPSLNPGPLPAGVSAALPATSSRAPGFSGRREGHTWTAPLADTCGCSEGNFGTLQSP